jgi:transposase
MKKITSPRILVLTEEAKTILESWLKTTRTTNGRATRARILLALHEGYNPTEVAQAQNVSRKTVYKWIHRYEAGGIEGLDDEPRPGRPSVLTPETIERVLRMTTEEVPEEATHWSIQLMAKHAGITTWQVRQIWGSAGLQPHRIRTFKISKDPAFAEKVIDIVGLYMNPPDNALILSVDEKTQIQALDRTQPGLPLNPGYVGSRTHDYKRNGTVALYAAYDILTGTVIGKVRPKTNGNEFLAFMKEVRRKTPRDQELHIILDNLSAHKTPEVQKWQGANPDVHFHFTPTSSSWLNAVEGWFAQLERRSLYRGVFTSVTELKREIERFIKVHNKELAKPFRWTKDAATLIGAVERAKQVLPN